MKIVHVIGYFQPELGYEEFYTAREQTRLGHDVAVITSDRIFPFSDEIKSALSETGMDTRTRRRPRGKSEFDGIQVHRLPKAFEGLYDFVTVLGMKDALTELKPDIVHAHETIQGTPALAALHKKLGFKLVVDHHGYAPSYGEQSTPKNKLTELEYRLIRRPLANSAFKRADAIIAVTEKTKQFLVDYHKISSDKITVLPLAVDTDMFKYDPDLRKKIRKEHGIGDNEQVLITTGRFDPAKKLENFITAFNELSAPDTRMLIIGSGNHDYTRKLKDTAFNKVNSSTKEGKIKFLPFMHQHKLPGWYSAADIGFWGKASITIIEGMACNLPIIVPDLDTVRHLANNKNGFLLKSLKVSEIKNTYEKIFKARDKISRMGIHSQEIVKNEYNYNTRTRKLMEIYKSCF